MNEVKVQPGTGGKKSYVVAGAILSCSYGTQPTRLKRPVSHGVYVKNKAQMNIGDYAPGVNIPPFGNCSSPFNPTVQASQMVDIYGVRKAPCVPVLTMPWLNGKSDMRIEGQPALTQNCTQHCLYRGQIRIENDGQELD